MSVASVSGRNRVARKIASLPLRAPADVSDNDIMLAHEAGMTAYPCSVHDNPYGNVSLREAWLQGHISARLMSGAVS